MIKCVTMNCAPFCCSFEKLRQMQTAHTHSTIYHIHRYAHARSLNACVNIEITIKFSHKLYFSVSYYLNGGLFVHLAHAELYLKQKKCSHDFGLTARFNRDE